MIARRSPDPGLLAALGDRRIKATREEITRRPTRPAHRSSPLPPETISEAVRCTGDDAYHGDRPARSMRRIARLDEETKAQPRPVPLSRSLIELLVRSPASALLGAITIILSEIGRDMSRFPSAGHLVAWAGLCPGQNESAGKRKGPRVFGKGFLG